MGPAPATSSSPVLSSSCFLLISPTTQVVQPFSSSSNSSIVFSNCSLTPYMSNVPLESPGVTRDVPRGARIDFNPWEGIEDLSNFGAAAIDPVYTLWGNETHWLPLLDDQKRPQTVAGLNAIHRAADWLIEKGFDSIKLNFDTLDDLDEKWQDDWDIERPFLRLKEILKGRKQLKHIYLWVFCRTIKHKARCYYPYQKVGGDVVTEEMWAICLKKQFEGMQHLTEKLVQDPIFAGQSFYLGNHEGDNMFDKAPPHSTGLQEWFVARQRGVSVKRSSADEGGRVFHYIEMNRLPLECRYQNLEKSAYIWDHVIGKVAADMLSYSAYDIKDSKGEYAREYHQVLSAGFAPDQLDILSQKKGELTFKDILLRLSKKFATAELIKDDQSYLMKFLGNKSSENESSENNSESWQDFSEDSMTRFIIGEFGTGRHEGHCKGDPNRHRELNITMRKALQYAGCKKLLFWQVFSNFEKDTNKIKEKGPDEKLFGLVPHPSNTIGLKRAI